MSKMFGVAAVIVAIGAFIAAIGATVVNFISLKWAMKIYEPIDHIVRKSEPYVDKLLKEAEKQLDEDDD